MALALLPGAERVLAAQTAALPQPDQLCGPFTAAAALHAVLDDPPGVTELALASGTHVWPHDVAAWRPAGAPLDRRGWDVLPTAPSPEASGTDAAALVAGIGIATAGRVSVLAVPGSADPAPYRTLLADLVRAPYPLAVLANVRTGGLGVAWDVGHFVGLWAYDAEADEVGLADTYVELGAEGLPPGARTVGVPALAAALSAPPGRGLLLLTRPDDVVAASGSVAAAGLPTGVWAT